MPVTISFNGSNYLVPVAGDSGWGGSLTNWITDVSANAVTPTILSSGATTGVFSSVRTLSTSGPTWTAGTGAPSATQPLGSLYSRTDGGVGTTLYVSRGAGVWNAVASV